MSMWRPTGPGSAAWPNCSEMASSPFPSAGPTGSQKARRRSKGRSAGPVAKRSHCSCEHPPASRFRPEALPLHRGDHGMAPVIDPDAGRGGATAGLEGDRGFVGDPVESAPEPSARLDQRIGGSGPESRAVSPTWMTAPAREPEVRAVQTRLAGDTELGEVGSGDGAAAVDVEIEARAGTEV